MMCVRSCSHTNNSQPTCIQVRPGWRYDQNPLWAKVAGGLNQPDTCSPFPTVVFLVLVTYSRFAGSLGVGEPKANTEGDEEEDEEDEDMRVEVAGAKGDDDANGEGDENEK